MCGNITVPDVRRDGEAGQPVSAAGTPALTVLWGWQEPSCVFLYCFVHEDSAQMGDHKGLLMML